MQPYIRINELLWKPHPAVEAARKHDAWRDFHRRCGEQNLFFDLPSVAGKSGFTIVALTTHRHRAGGVLAEKLGEGKGKTPFLALEAAYQAAGRPVPAAEPLLARMLGGAVEIEDFDAALGGDDDDFMEALG